MSAEVRARVLSAIHMAEGNRSSGQVTMTDVLNVMRLRGDRIARAYVQEAINDLLERGKIKQVQLGDLQAFERTDRELPYNH